MTILTAVSRSVPRAEYARKVKGAAPPEATMRGINLSAIGFAACAMLLIVSISTLSRFPPLAIWLPPLTQ